VTLYVLIEKTHFSIPESDLSGDKLCYFLEESKPRVMNTNINSVNTKCKVVENSMIIGVG